MGKAVMAMRTVMLVALAGMLSACGSKEGAVAPVADQPSTQGPAGGAIAQPLEVQVYNPGENGIFAVSSVLLSGVNDAVLVDAQFSTADAAKLVEMIKASRKKLTTIYISHGDPDFYFGLETLHAAFPDAQILATPQTIAHIQASKDEKLRIWGPQLGANAPGTLLVPSPLQGDSLQLEGQTLQVIGLDGASPGRTVLWVPSIRTVMGGVLVDAGSHVFMADTQTPQSHQDWLAALQRIQALEPLRVIPGHYAAGAPQDMAAVEFTAGYIRAFDEEAAKTKSANALMAAMKQRYPGLEGEASLELSAKVAKGEMDWK
ncbi:MBL fold metallo-hydrolase [Stenotrophomonas sp.]|uniref:MBL fold metallo-hydrolase n=1 Tax=Stenotrophomonas sp. TaxID=69392 RepID=UPI0028AD93E7|nr:MBL fold metallo-hydrolase [Stenotrophomonas sp.]